MAAALRICDTVLSSEDDIDELCVIGDAADGIVKYM